MVVPPAVVPATLETIPPPFDLSPREKHFQICIPSKPCYPPSKLYDQHTKFENPSLSRGGYEYLGWIVFPYE